MFPPLSGGCQGTVSFPAWWSMKCKVIAVQIQHKQMNLFFFQKPFVFILMQPHSTNINLFLQGFLQPPVPPHMGSQSSFLQQAQVSPFPWPSRLFRTPDIQKPSSNSQEQFIHNQYVTIWSCANGILQLKELFPLLSIFHPAYLLRGITSPLTFVRPG